jgi:hypothetical protein
VGGEHLLSLQLALEALKKVKIHCVIQFKGCTFISKHMELKDYSSLRLHPKDIAAVDFIIITFSVSLVGYYGRTLDPGIDRPMPWNARAPSLTCRPYANRITF